MSLVVLFSGHLLKLPFRQTLGDNGKYCEKVALSALMNTFKNEYPVLHFFNSKSSFSCLFYHCLLVLCGDKNSISGKTIIFGPYHTNLSLNSSGTQLLLEVT